MRGVGLVAAAVLSAGVGVQAYAADAPVLTLRDGALSLSSLPPVLTDEAVARHLQTGLTTVFLFTVEWRPGPQQGAAQVGVRYDLWDEVYHVEPVPGPPLNAVVPARSKPALLEWWRTAVLRLAPAGGRRVPASGRAKVTLQVLPFSQAEQRDAQDWLLRAFRAGAPAPQVARETAGRPGEHAPEPAPVRDFYGAMLASSIGRRELIRWTWIVPVVVEGR